MSKNLPVAVQADIDAFFENEKEYKLTGLKGAMLYLASGEILLRMQSKLSDSDWRVWLSTCNLTRSEISKRMTVAKQADKIRENFSNLKDVSAHTLYRFCAKPHTPRPQLSASPSTGPSAPRAVRGQNPSSGARPSVSADTPDAALQHAQPPIPQTGAEEPASLDDMPYREPEQHEQPETLEAPAAPEMPASHAQPPLAEAAAGSPSGLSGAVVYFADHPELLHDWRIIRPWLQALLDEDSPTPTQLAEQIDFDDLPAVVTEVEDGIEFLRELEGALRKLYGGSDFDPRAKAVLVDAGDDREDDEEEMEL